MKKANLKTIMSGIKAATIKHSPEILIGVGIAGMITAGVLAVKVTPKAVRLIESEEKHIAETEGCDEAKLTPVEVVKVTWKCYLPSVITAILSAGCIISAGAVHTRRNTALATALSLSEATLREYSDKVVEVVGEKKEREVRDAIAEDKFNQNPPKKRDIIITGKGDTLCYDPLSGRYFYSDIEVIRKAENDINKTLRDDMTVSLNEFYQEIGLEDNDIGNMVGWNIDKGYIELIFTSKLTDWDAPCLVITYKTPPTHCFNYFN